MLMDRTELRVTLIFTVNGKFYPSVVCKSKSNKKKSVNFINVRNQQTSAPYLNTLSINCSLCGAAQSLIPFLILRSLNSRFTD